MPITRALAARHRVTGVDISARQLALAESNLVGATFICADIMMQTFPSASYDAIVSYYTLFHLPRTEQRVLIKRISKWLRPGGLLLATVADEDAKGYVESDFFGVRMFWSHFGLREYEHILLSSGFRLLESGVEGHGYRKSAACPAEEHPYVLAERI